MNARDQIDLLRAVYQGDRERLERVVSSEDFAAEEWVGFVCRHQLAGTVFWLLQRRGLLEAMPEAATEPLRMFSLRQWGKNQVLVRRAREVRGLLAAAGIHHLWLKGVFLAQRHYGDVEARGVGDLDLLVRDSDVQRAGRLLCANGFERRSRVVWSERITAHFTHHFEFRRGDLDLELHWALGRHPAFRVRSEDLWNRQRTVEIQGTEFAVPGDEYALVGHILGAFRDIELGTVSLKPFGDLLQMSRQVDLDWEEFFDRRRKEGVYRISLNMLATAIELFDGGRLAPALREQIERRRKDLQFRSAPGAMDLIQRTGKVALSTRWWAWKLYELDPMRAFAWWAVSLPFRMAVSPGR